MSPRRTPQAARAGQVTAEVSVGYDLPAKAGETPDVTYADGWEGIGRGEFTRAPSPGLARSVGARVARDVTVAQRGRVTGLVVRVFRFDAVQWVHEGDTVSDAERVLVSEQYGTWDPDTLTATWDDPKRTDR